MNHIVLLGDSIFDNAEYVPGEPAVIDQVRDRLSETDSATLLAVDGDVVSDVPEQLSQLPEGTTHFFISVGGNDALGKSHILESDGEAIVPQLVQAHEEFHTDYRSMLQHVCRHTHRRRRTV